MDGVTNCVNKQGTVNVGCCVGDSEGIVGDDVGTVGSAVGSLV